MVKWCTSEVTGYLLCVTQQQNQWSREITMTRILSYLVGAISVLFVTTNEQSKHCFIYHIVHIFE